MPDTAPTATENELRTALENGGHRYTAQRAAVFEVLGSTDTHPTADEIFTEVREQIPDISLATVYKALEAFVSCGVAKKLTYGEGPARYDGRTDDHDHVRCTACGKVRDVDESHVTDWLDSVRSKTEFEVLDYRLELLGRCPDCRH